MKVIFFFLCMALYTANCFAQEIKAYTIPGSNEAKAYEITSHNWSKQVDSVLRSKNNYLKSKPDTVIDNNQLPYIPNAIPKQSPPDIYVGNNGQGQDIYRSQVDNMAILKPDNTFNSGMPNAFQKVTPPVTVPKAPQRVWIQPRNYNKTP